MLTQTAIRSGSFKRPTKQTVPPVATHGFGGTIDLMGAPMSFTRNAEIYGEDEPADYLYKVVSGSVRTYKDLRRWPPPDWGVLFSGRRIRP